MKCFIKSKRVLSGIQTRMCEYLTIKINDANMKVYFLYLNFMRRYSVNILPRHCQRLIEPILLTALDIGNRVI